MTVAAAPTLRRALLPVTALLMGTTLLFLGFGLQATLVPLRADFEGFDELVIGLLGSGYYAGFIIGCLIAPSVIRRAGHIRAFAAMVSCLSAIALVFPIFVDGAPWILFRVIVGVCMSVVLVIIESWLNEVSSDRTRGAVMSTYVIICYGSLTLGQLGVATQPLTAFSLFALCSIMVSLAAVPVVLTKSSQPAPPPAVHFRPLALWNLAPAAFVGALCCGLMVGSVLSLSAVYAVESGLTASEAALFASAIVLGGALGQYPFGRTSDFVDRRLVLLVAAAATCALALFLLIGPALPITVVLIGGLVLGAALLPAYALAAAHAYDWTEPENLVETSASVNLTFGVGSTVGPILAASLMSLFGPAGLFITVAAASGALSLFIAARLLMRSRPDEAQRNEFDLYATASVGAAVPYDTHEETAHTDTDATPPPVQKSADNDDMEGVQPAGGENVP